ncbi:hypothetical protein ABIF63_006010 [Bradyrhizobium japonicum]|uniref:SGNH hydrolase-type esterase domain-containing protein n=1 Tax=Bradyrhizobium japonicum TaxID=375 RepID=A0ABV2RY94_BRAJP
MAFPLALFDSYSYAGRTQINQQSLSGTIRHFVIIGTSTSSNTVNATFSPANPTKCLNLSLDNGGIYQCLDPLLDCAVPTSNTGNWTFDFADQLVTAGKASYVNVVPLGNPNGVAADWKVGGPLTPKLAVAKNRLQARGWAADAVLVMTGENNGAHGTSQAQMTTDLGSVYTAIRNAGFTCPVILSTTSYILGVTYSAITNAQATAQGNGTFTAGPNTDTIGGAGRYDTTHFNATGRTSCATLWKNSVVSVLGI